MLFGKCLLFSSLAAAWTIENAGVVVTGKSTGGAEHESLKSLTRPVELYQDTSIDIAFKLSGTPLPHQVAIRVSASASGSDAGAIDRIVPAKMRGSKAKVIVPFGLLPTELHNYELDVTLLLSNLNGEHFEEKLFDLVAYGQTDDKAASLHRSTGSGATLVTKPQIFHQFRGKPKHVNPILALGASSAIVVAFAGLLKVWSDIWSNSKHTAESRIQVSELIRWGLVASIEVVFLLYYWGMSIFTTLQYALPPFALLLAYSHYLQKN